MPMKNLSKNRMVKRGRRIIPNALLIAHRSETSHFRCSHCRCDKCKANPVPSDKKTGMCRIWHKNGQLAFKCSYRDGVFNGFLRSWWPDGKPMDEQVYDMGEPQLIRLFDRLTGQLRTQVVSDGCATRQKHFDFKTKKWRRYFFIHDKDVSRREYLSFLKRQKNVSIDMKSK